MSSFKSFALIPPSWLKRLQANERYFGDVNRGAVLDGDEKIENIIRNKKQPAFTRVRQYDQVRRQLDTAKAKVPKKQTTTATSPPSTHVETQAEQQQQQQQQVMPEVEEEEEEEYVDASSDDPQHLQASPQREPAAAVQQPTVQQPVAAVKKQAPPAQAHEPAAEAQQQQPSTSQARAATPDIYDQVSEYVNQLTGRTAVTAKAAYAKLLKHGDKISINPDYTITYMKKVVPGSDVRELLRRHSAPPLSTPLRGLAEFSHAISGFPPAAKRFCHVHSLGK